MATRKANKATAGELAASVSPTCIIRDENFSFSVKATSDVHDDERDQIWQTFEENMYELYRSSSFGWNPRKKKTEMFNRLSRVVAYSIFRFEREDRQNVVYCYELQVSKDSRRFGLGRLLIQMLSDIGAQWGMTKVMLTVLQANHAAVSFYKAIGFSTDEASPDFSRDPEDGGENERDYYILSRRIR